MILGTETATRYRYPEESRDPDTGRTIDGTPSTMEFQGSFQPLDGSEREALPEGVRTTATIKCYTKTNFRTDVQADNLPADEVEYDGDRFVVYDVDKWPKLLDHYKALLIKKQEQ